MASSGQGRGTEPAGLGELISQARVFEAFGKEQKARAQELERRIKVYDDFLSSRPIDGDVGKSKTAWVEPNQTIDPKQVHSLEVPPMPAEEHVDKIIDQARELKTFGQEQERRLQFLEARIKEYEDFLKSTPIVIDPFASGDRHCEIIDPKWVHGFEIPLCTKPWRLSGSTAIAFDPIETNFVIMNKNAMASGDFNEIKLPSYHFPSDYITVYETRDEEGQWSLEAQNSSKLKGTQQELVTFPISALGCGIVFYRILKKITKLHILVASPSVYQGTRITLARRQRLKDIDELLQAAQDGNQERIAELLHKGTDVNAQGGTFGNALQAASLKGHYRIVELLLENGADVNAQGGRFGNALQAASFNGYDKIVELLLENGADVNAQGGKFGNALQAASLKGPYKIVELLLENGAKVDAQGGTYGNALLAASYSHEPQIPSDQVKIVKLLLVKGAEVNKDQGGGGDGDGDFRTALQAASYSGNKEIVYLLLEKGANVKAPGGRLGNALQAANLRGNREIENLLWENGARWGN